MDDHYNDNSRDDRMNIESRDYLDDRRGRRDLWDERDLDR